MKLCNFSNTDYHLGWYDSNWNNLKDFLYENKLDGIELLLHGNHNTDGIPSGLVKGLHLSYFPTWLEFYNDDESYLIDYPTESELIRTFGGVDKKAIIDKYKEEYKIAKELDASYMVFHVSHVTLKDAFSFSYNYSNKDVIEAVIDVVNQVFTEESGVTLLFENLWWPGLTLLSKEELDYLMENVNYENCGIMLDLSHLLATNKNIGNIKTGTNYIIKCIEDLGDSKKHIKGLHINSTLSGEYLDIKHEDKYLKYKSEKDDFKKFEIIHKHISSIDSHKPYSCYSLNKIIKLVDPKYKVIEVIGKDKDTWESYVISQLSYMEE